MEKSPFFYNIVLGAFNKAIKEKSIKHIMLHAEKVKEYILSHKIEYAQKRVIELFELGKEHILTEQKITYLKYEIEVLRF